MQTKFVEYSVYKESKSKSSIFIVIPAFNEEKVIKSVVENLLEKDKYSVVVVDDGSTDSTIDKIADLPITILQHHQNYGMGASLRTGFAFSLHNDAKYIISFDADGQHISEDIPALLLPLQSGKAEVTLGSRFLTKASGKTVPPARRFLLKNAIQFTRLLSNIQVTDTHNGLRAFKASALKKIEFSQNRMAHASEILHIISKKNISFMEVPVTVIYTDYSLRKGQRMVNAFNILWDLIRVKFKL